MGSDHSGPSYKAQTFAGILGLALLADAGLSNNPAAWQPHANLPTSRPLERVFYAACIVVPLLLAIALSDICAGYLRRKGISHEFQGSWIRAGAWTFLTALFLGALISHL